MRWQPLWMSGSWSQPTWTKEGIFTYSILYLIWWRYCAEIGWIWWRGWSAWARWVWEMLNRGRKLNKWFITTSLDINHWLFRSISKILCLLKGWNLTSEFGCCWIKMKRFISSRKGIYVSQARSINLTIILWKTTTNTWPTTHFRNTVRSMRATKGFEGWVLWDSFWRRRGGNTAMTGFWLKSRKL